MNRLLVYAGELSDLVLLDDVLREAHEQSKQMRDLLIADRTRRRIPLDDSTDWLAVGDTISKIQESKADSAKLFLLACELRDQTEGNAIEPLGEYESLELVKGIKVQFKMISAAQARILQAELQNIFRKKRDAYKSEDSLKIAEVENELEAACGKYVSTLVNKIEGIDLGGKSIEESIDALIGDNLLAFLFSACRYFLSLPRKKALRCGAAQQST